MSHNDPVSVNQMFQNEENRTKYPEMFSLTEGGVSDDIIDSILHRMSPEVAQIERSVNEFDAEVSSYNNQLASCTSFKRDDVDNSRSFVPIREVPHFDHEGLCRGNFLVVY